MFVKKCSFFVKNCNIWQNSLFFFEKFLIFLKNFLIFCKKCYNTHFCINIVKQPCFSDFPRVSRLELEVAFFVNIFFFEFFSKFLWHRIYTLRSPDRNSGFLSKIWDSQHRNVAFFSSLEGRTRNSGGWQLSKLRDDKNDNCAKFTLSGKNPEFCVKYSLLQGKQC